MDKILQRILPLLFTTNLMKYTLLHSISIVYCLVVISCKRDSISKIDEATIKQRLQILQDYNYLASTYRANVEFDSISPIYTSEFQEILTQQDTVIFSNYRIVDIERADDCFYATIKKRGNSKVFGKIRCDKEQLQQLLSGQDLSTASGRKKRSYLLLKIHGINKILFEFRTYTGSSGSEIELKTAVPPKQFFFEGTLIEGIQL